MNADDAGPGTRVVLIATPPQELCTTGKNSSLTDAMFNAYNECGKKHLDNDGDAENSMRGCL